MQTKYQNIKSFFLSLLCLFILLSLCSCKEDESTSGGYPDFEESYDYGLSIGFDQGYESGYSHGCSDGYTDGYEEGYSDGSFDGYYDGATYTCLFFRDIDRAFMSAMNGSSWYTFIDGYDEYISDIYQTDEQRLNLIWSIVAVNSDSGFTEDERDLLIATFGRDMFIRNGVNIDKIKIQ